MGVGVMKHTLKLEGSYTAFAHAYVELPEGMTDKDVTHVYDKWGTLYVELSDGSVLEQLINIDMFDTKKLDYCNIYSNEMELLNV